MGGPIGRRLWEASTLFAGAKAAWLHGAAALGDRIWGCSSAVVALRLLKVTVYGSLSTACRQKALVLVRVTV